MLDNENPRHPTQSGQEALRCFDASDAPRQKGDSNDDPKASAWLSDVPPKPSTTPFAAYFSAADTAPTQSPIAALQDTTAAQPLEIDYNTLLLLNTNGHTTPPTEIGRTQWFPFFQSQDTVTSPSQQHAEEHWDFTPATEPFATGAMAGTAGSMHIRPSRLSYSDIYHPGSSRLHDGAAHNDFLDAYPSTGSLPHTATLPDSPLAHPMSLGACSVRNRYRPQPPSKIKMFFSKLKAYIKAPFRRHRK